MPEALKSRLPLSFASIKAPAMVCLITANGGGTKLLQSFLDSHPQIYNIPAYPMIYFYPHWIDWEKQLADCWNWEAIIDKFCEKHASVIDSRRIVGFNGLDQLGDNKDEHVEIDEGLFRQYLKEMLQGEPIKRTTFLLAVHYAFALCNGEDISKEKVLLWHHHDYEKFADYLADFPDSIVLGMIRDGRPKVLREYDVFLKVDIGKLSASDAMIYRPYAFNNANLHVFYRLNVIPSLFPMERVYYIRHEDLKFDLEGIMRSLAKLLDIDFCPSMLQTTFNGKLWWGHKIYNMGQVTGTFAGVISKAWVKKFTKVELFVMGGIFLDFNQRYGYENLVYEKDTLWDRILLCTALLWPFSMEWYNLFYYLDPRNHWLLIKTAYLESTGRLPRPDYTWNATYLYKWTYLPFKLYKTRWYCSFLDFSKGLKADGKWKPIAPALLFVSRICFVGAHYVRFLLTLLRMPVIIFRRMAMFYSVLFRRLRHDQSMFAQLLTGQNA
jgi:hypothetical protein